MKKIKIPTAPKNAKEAIAQSKALINKYAVPSKAKTVKTFTKPKTDSKKTEVKNGGNNNVKQEKKKQTPAENFKEQFKKAAQNMKRNKEGLTPMEQTAKNIADQRKRIESKKAEVKKTKQKSVQDKTKAVVEKRKSEIEKAKNTKPKKEEVTTPKKESFNLDAEVKNVMSGKYGTGAARKAALGDNYAKVQAEINKRMANAKPKTTPTKEASKTVEAPEKMEIRRPGPIDYTGPKELQLMTAEQRMNANIDKLNKEKKKYGGMIKKQYGRSIKTKKR